MSEDTLDVSVMENDLDFINEAFQKMESYLEALDKFRKKLAELKDKKTIFRSFISDVRETCNRNAKIGKYGVTEQITWAQVNIFFKSKYLQIDNYKIVPNCLELLEHYKNNLQLHNIVWETHAHKSPKNRGIKKTDVENGEREL